MSAMTLAQRIEHDLKSNGGEYVICNNGPGKKSGVWEAFDIVYDRSNVIQTVFDIGSNSTNRVTIDELLTNPLTVSRNVNSRARNGRDKLTFILKKHFDSGLNVPCTLDLWMDTVKKNSYMSITIHYIDEMFNLYARTLHVKPVEKVSHTTEMVLEEFSKGLAMFKVMADMY